jgi:hypothetical protein
MVIARRFRDLVFEILPLGTAIFLLNLSDAVAKCEKNTPFDRPCQPEPAVGPSPNHASARHAPGVQRVGRATACYGVLRNFSFRAFSTTGGTISDMSPPKIATSFMLDDRSTKYFWSVGMRIVSILGLRARFIIESSNS